MRPIDERGGWGDVDIDASKQVGDSDDMGWTEELYDGDVAAQQVWVEYLNETGRMLQ